MSVGFPKDVILDLNSPNKVSMNPNVTHWECKTLISFSRYAESSNHVMVFCEALYLNTLISVSTFSENNHFKFYILAGWIGPLLWIVPFIVLMAVFENENTCWNAETTFSYMHVVPQVALIFMNFFLFINIVRILQNKLKKNRLTDSKQYRYKKLAKSTLILLPLFSIYYIAFSVWQPFVRGKLAIEFELIRLYFEIICSSFQGLAISLIYCFFNSEVRHEMIRQIDRILLRYYPNMTSLSSTLNNNNNMNHNRERTYSTASLNQRVNTDVGNERRKSSKMSESSSTRKMRKEKKISLSLNAENNKLLTGNTADLNNNHHQVENNNKNSSNTNNNKSTCFTACIKNKEDLHLHANNNVQISAENDMKNGEEELVVSYNNNNNNNNNNQNSV